MIYEDVIAELIQQKIINSVDAFDCKKSKISHILYQYFTFCQENLLLSEQDLNIKPARVFYSDCYTVNGYAAKEPNSGYYVVKIPYGTMEILWWFFTEKNDIFKQEKFAQYALLDPALDSSIIFLMYQAATQFTYYHERTHLDQLSVKGSFSFLEAYMQDSQEKYSHTHHVCECDADLVAADFCVQHLLNYWDKLDTIIRNSANLHLILSFGAASLITYFFYLTGLESREIYYKETRHPHPLIRISYIINHFVNVIAANGISLENRKVVNDALLLAEEMFLMDGNNKLQFYSGIYNREEEEINIFIRELLIQTKQFRADLDRIKKESGSL